MATKTLEDTKPTLQDDDCVKSEIPKNDTSSGDATIKLKDAKAGDKDETSGYQVEEKKEEIDEDEEEKEEEEISNEELSKNIQEREGGRGREWI